jgi:uroporphyrinogen-III synthase
LRIKSLLISQPEPKDERSPFYDLQEKYNVKLTFNKFFRVEPVPAIEFLKERVRILDYSAVIMTSRTAIEHFFRICKETRVEVPSKMQFFCLSESYALYLQKFTTYRKRKIFYPKTKDKSLKDLIIKHSDEKFLMPTSNVCNSDIPLFLENNDIKYTPVILFNTLTSDLSAIDIYSYDILAFFSPAGIKSLFENFKNFQQNDIKIAAFGDHTINAVKEAGLRLDIEAPTPQAPSMKMALEQYIKNFNK